MLDLLKVGFHCLLKTFANLRGEDHRIITYHFLTAGIKGWKCTCGYDPNKKETESHE